MHAKHRAAAAAFSILVLSGCASMSGEECVATDWSAVGYEDGARGYTAEAFSRHRKACARHGVTADFAAYRSGREQGLTEYCRPGRGFDVGASGARYHGVCRVDLEKDFLDAYNAGYQLYTLRANVSRANSSIDARQGDLEGVQAEIRTKEAALLSSETTTEQRILLLADLKELSARTGRLEAEIQELHELRARYQADLEDYRVTVADYGY